MLQGDPDLGILGISRRRREILTRELEAVGMRLNRKPPNIYFRKKKTGGVQVGAQPLGQAALNLGAGLAVPRQRLPASLAECWAHLKATPPGRGPAWRVRTRSVAICDCCRDRTGRRRVAQRRGAGAGGERGSVWQRAAQAGRQGASQFPR